MTTFAAHRETMEAFRDCMNSGSDRETFSNLFAEDVVLHGPLGQERVGRDIVVAGSQSLFGRATSDKYGEVFSGTDTHCVRYRLEVGGAGIDGIYQARLNDEGKIVEVTIWWRTVPDAVALQRAVADIWGQEPWELRTGGE
jgi:hypothetical protein